ncbi:MAG TPA: LLM class flavin-dependent oxidoreductase [Stellaceae bacterium]|nr:LLM class flavin-dependent oxidoreductase [Stellaceae bacterium]
MSVRIGISFDGFSTFDAALETARQAAATGVTSLWMADHLGFREAILSSLGLAMAAPGARVVPTAISPYLRHPMPTAMQMATLAEAAPGRVALAVGIGNPLFLGESGEAIVKPVRIVREFVQALRALWSGESVTQEAMRFRLCGARMMFPPPAPIPIYLAPMRAQMLRLSGRIADGVVLSSGISPNYARHSLAIAAEGATAAGRNARGLEAAGYIFVAASPDRRRAIDAVRRKLAFVLRNRFLDENIAFSGIPIDQDAIIAAISQRDLDAATHLVSDDAVEAFGAAGTVRDCCDKLQAFIDAGLNELVLAICSETEDQPYGWDLVRELRG